jgi:hypothetical protein
MFSIATSPQSLLSQIPDGFDKNQALPPQAAMRILRPTLCQHADLRAVDLFEHWVSERKTNINLEQATWMWVHWEMLFIRELPDRFEQWVKDRSERSPYQLGVDFARLIVSRRWNPWALRKSATLFGRVQIKLIKALGNFLMFVMFYWMALAGWMTLGALRERFIVIQ